MSAVLELSTSGASPVTVTVSSTDDTRIAMFRSAAAPTFSVVSSCRNFANPWSSAVRLYFPGVSPGNL